MPKRPHPARPRALREGARVALVAPAGPVTEGRVSAACEYANALGLDAVVFGVGRASGPGRPAAKSGQSGKPGDAGPGFLAAPDPARLEALQAAFDDSSVDAVWAIRGGYGTLRILSRLDLGRQERDPIPFIGFSDNTTIHVRHAAMGIVSFHGPHPGGPFPPESEASFRRVLFSPEPAGLVASRPGDPRPIPLEGGRVEGALYGGNLALLAALCGSADAPSARGRILLVEDTGEPAYRVDRMLVQLERAGALDGVLGLAGGRFTGPTEEDEPATVEVLREWGRRLRIPAVAGLPFGHVDHNATLPLGVRAALDGDAATLTLLEGAVSG